MSDFNAFKAGQPAKAMFRKLGLSEYLEGAGSWRSLRSLIVDFNGCDEGNFVKLARECDGVASSGERVLLHAILYVTDFAWLADELDAGKASPACDRNTTWRRMNSAGGAWKQAVAACVGADL